MIDFFIIMKCPYLCLTTVFKVYFEKQQQQANKQKVCFVWYKNSFSSFLLVFICMGYLFHALTFNLASPEVSLLEAAYRLVFKKSPFWHSVSFWEFSALTFKLIIDSYVLIDILLIVLAFFYFILFCFVVLFLFFFCCLPLCDDFLLWYA